jgi:hypothetical protein
VGTSGGVWDGVSFKMAATSNPAWHVYDILTNERYGFGLPSNILGATVFDLYTIAQYCDQSVPDGFGGTEPRYTSNVAINSASDAYQLLLNMVSAFRGMFYWGAGTVHISADMPKETTAVVTQANVINGEFTLEGTGLDTRHTVARVNWLDPSNFYASTYEVVEDPEGVAARGQVPVDIQAWGVTSRGLAHRLAKWVLDTEKTANETLTFKAGNDQLQLRPGMIFEQHDPSYMGLRAGGRLQGSNTSTVVNADALVPPLDAGITSYLTVQMPDGSVVADRAIASIATSANGLYSIITLASALTGVAPTVPWQAGATYDTVGAYVESSGQAYRLVVPGVAGTTPPSGTGVVVDGSCHWLWVSAVGATVELAPDANAVWLLSAPGSSTNSVNVRRWLTLGSVETQRGMQQIVATVYDPAKFDRVENNLAFTPTTFSKFPALLATAIPPPTNLSISVFQGGVGTTVLPSASIGWTSPKDPRAFAFEVQAQGQSTTTIASSSSPLYGIPQTAWQQATVYTVGATAAANGAIWQCAAVTGDAKSAATGSGPGATGWCPWPTTRRGSMRCSMRASTWSPPGAGRGRRGRRARAPGSPMAPWCGATCPAPRPSSTTTSPGPISAPPSSRPGSRAAAGDGHHLRMGRASPWRLRFQRADGGPRGQSSAWTSSSPVTVTKDTIVPTAPTGVTAAGGARLVTVSWNPNPERFIDHYEVWRNTTTAGPGAGATYLAKVAVTKFVDIDSVLGAAGTWYDWVNAVGATGTAGAFAGPVSATTTAVTADSVAASAITGTISAGQIGGVNASVITGGITAGQITGVNASAVTGTLTASQIGTVNATSVTGTLTAGQIGSVNATSIAGTLTSGQIGSVNASSITGGITASQISGVNASAIKGGIAATQITSVTAGQVTGTLSASQIGSVNATSITGGIVASQISAVNASAITGGIAATQITSLAAGQITGTLSASQIGGVNAGSLVGSIVATQISSITAGQITGTLTSGQISSIGAGQVTGTLSASQIGGVNVGSLIGTISSSQISSLTAGQITGTLTAGQIGSVNASAVTGTLTASQIGGVNAGSLVGSIVATQISSLTAGQITGTLTAGQIGSIGATQIAGTLTSSQIGSVGAIQITGTLTDSQIASLSALKVSGTLSSASLPAGNILGSLTASQISGVNVGVLVGTLSASQIGGVNVSTLIGTLTASQIGSVNAPAITGTLTAGQIGGVNASTVAGTLTSSQIGSVNATSITGGITSSQITSVSAVAVTGTLTASQIGSVNASAVSGTLTASQIGAVNATSITGGITSNQITSVSAVAVTGTLTASQIGSVAASTLTGSVTAAQISGVNASTITGGIAASQISSVNASAVTGTLTASQIGSVAAGSITGTLTSGQIGSVAAGSITGTLTSSQIGSVNVGVLNGTLVTSQIGTLQVTTPLLASGAVSGAVIDTRTSALTFSPTYSTAAAVTVAVSANSNVLISMYSLVDVGGGGLLYRRVAQAEPPKEYPDNGYYLSYPPEQRRQRCHRDFWTAIRLHLYDHHRRATGSRNLHLLFGDHLQSVCRRSHPLDDQCRSGEEVTDFSGYMTETGRVSVVTVGADGLIGGMGSCHIAVLEATPCQRPWHGAGDAGGSREIHPRQPLGVGRRGHRAGHPPA